MDRIRSELQDVFRQIFDDDDLVITDGTNATEVDGWDSMAHINLTIAIEKRFGIKFSASDLASMRGPGQNVGNLVKLLVARSTLKGEKA